MSGLWCRVLFVARPFVCGLLKVRNETVREGNIRRCLENMVAFCDTMVVCDDASTDGTDLIIEDFFRQHGIPLDQFLRIEPADQDFRKELRVKAMMLHKIHKLQPKWIWWQDADEVVPEPSKLLSLLVEDSLQERARMEVRGADEPDAKHLPEYGAYRFPYVQLWRNGCWARTDDGFADGIFVKLWRWRIDLEFDIVDRTHHMQFPHNVGEIGDAPDGLHVIHFGNYGKNLQWKAIQYHGGLGGVERHLDFEAATYRRLDYDYAAYPVRRAPQAPKPEPFELFEKKLIRSMENLRGMKEWFTVVIPTYNRADFLPETLTSLLRQTYPKWVAIVLDDGSTDDTERVMHKLALHDPRILYARHDRRGAVAMNEIGMRFACDATEWWTRLGSDDYFEPDKLLNDALALKYGQWCYGPYQVLRKHDERWQLDETCNLPEDGKFIVDQLLGGAFRVSWANIAARTSLLRLVRSRHKAFCDPRLQNMEDFLVNVRMARIAPPVFRARVRNAMGSHANKLLVTHDAKEMAYAIAYRDIFLADAVWRVNPIGASADSSTTNNDNELTQQLIKEDFTVLLTEAMTAGIVE